MVSRFFEFMHANHVEAIIVFTNANVDMVASPPIIISISQCGTKGIKYHILSQINMSKKNKNTEHFFKCAGRFSNKRMIQICSG